MRFSDNFTEQCSTNINSWATSFDQFFNLLELSWRMFSWYLFFKVRLGGTGRTIDQQADKLHFYMRMSQISQWLRIIKLNCEYTHSFSNMLVLLLNVFYVYLRYLSECSCAANSLDTYYNQLSHKHWTQQNPETLVLLIPGICSVHVASL